MDNDYSSYSREDLKDEIERLKAELNTEIVKGRIDLRDERDTLRAKVKELENRLDVKDAAWAVDIKVCDTLRARVEELTHRHEQQVERSESLRKERDGFMFVCGDLRAARNEALAERDDYKQRVEELEAKLEDCLTMSMNMEGLFNDVHEERDALRLKLDAFQDTKAYVSKLIEDNVALRAELEQIKEPTYKTHADGEWVPDGCGGLERRSNIPDPKLEQIKGEKMGEDRTWNLEPVTALRAENARLKANLDGTAEQNKFLSAQVREMGDQLKQVLLVNGRLSDELAATKPVPVVVKQTWQGVFDEYGLTDERAQDCIAEFGAHCGDPLVYKIRRDHYSDGTVKCELEPVTGAEIVK